MSVHGWQYSILQGIGARIEILAELYPRLYLLFMAVFALLGYACLLLFPLLALAGVAGTYQALAAFPGGAWLPLLAWLLVASSCGLVSYRLFQFRPSLPAGVVLDRSQAPALFQLVEDTRAHYAGPGIDHIVVTGEYQLDIVNTPVSALPVWSTRSLLVGLPLLQCLSTTRFQCALARRLGQHSGRTNRLLNWLYTLRSTWPRYREPAAGIDPAYLPVCAVFSLYAPLYTVLSTVAARLDELQADSYAMELFSDEDVLDTVTTDAVYRLYLREKYWPAIRKLHEQDAMALTNIAAHMATVLNAGLQSGNIVQWIEQAMAAEQQWDDPWPLLVRRLENIGHVQACMSTGRIEPAAAGYLATIRPKLEAALADLPPPLSLQVQSWPARLDGLRQRVQSATHGLLRRLKNMPYPGEHMDRGMHS
jgi:hypothetical protein